MIIDERIVQLLVPGTLQRLDPLTVPDQTATPYTTYLLMNAENLTTHDSPLPATRRWKAQFNTYSETYGITRTLGNSIESTLVGYTDANIIGCTPVRHQSSWDDIAKLYCSIVEVLITERLD